MGNHLYLHFHDMYDSFIKIHTSHLSKWSLLFHHVHIGTETKDLLCNKNARFHSYNIQMNSLFFSYTHMCMLTHETKNNRFRLAYIVLKISFLYIHLILSPRRRQTQNANSVGGIDLRVMCDLTQWEPIKMAYMLQVTFPNAFHDCQYLIFHSKFTDLSP